jgi:hypothetical protein
VIAVVILAIHAAKRLSAFLTPDRQVIVDFSAADFAFNFCHLLNLTCQRSFLNSEAAATPLDVLDTSTKGHGRGGSFHC